MIAVGFALVSVACHQSVTSGGGTGNTDMTLTRIKPANVKANRAGNIELHGSGFSATTRVLIDGVATEDLPGLSAAFQDSSLIYLTLVNAGIEKAADWKVSVSDPLGFTDPLDLHVRPVLTRLEYVRTIPEFFAPEGGEVEMWVQPVDSEEIVMLPGHEVAGEGLDVPNFAWSNIVLTHTASGTTVTPTSGSIIEVLYGPRFSGDTLGFVVAIDNSGSMSNNDTNDIRFEATKLFVDRLAPNAQMMTIEFDSNATVRTPFTNDKQLIKADLDALQGQGEGRGTAIYDAMMLALDNLETLGPGAAKIVICLTDGRDSDSSDNAQDVIARAAEVGAMIFNIGLGYSGNLESDELIGISRATGGSFFLADDAEALYLIFDQLANYQADSYRVIAELGFNPPLSDFGAYTMDLDLECNADDEFADTAITNAQLYVGQ